jgi:hypothetical protein
VKTHVGLTLLGIVYGGAVSSMLLKLSPNTWWRVLLMCSIYGNGATEFESIELSKRTSS